MKYRAEFHDNKGIIIDDLETDNLPPEWTLVSVHGQKREELVFLDWVVVGACKPSGNLEKEILRGLHAKGHGLDSAGFHYYPNRYKVKARGCILHGYYNE